MGQARDTLMQKAQTKAEETMHKVQQVAQEATESAKDAAKQEAKQQGLTKLRLAASDKARSSDAVGRTTLATRTNEAYRATTRKEREV